MKAVFIACNQALNERVLEALDRLHVRGFTKWEGTQGRGSFMGEPHYGSHAWPGINVAILTFVPDDKSKEVLDKMKEIDEQAPQHGLRAFAWKIEETME